MENTKAVYGLDIVEDLSLRQTFQYLGYTADVDGLNGVIPDYELVNISQGYRKSDWQIFLVAKNLMDRKYISSRLPEGIQPGPFRQINLGLSLNL